MKVKVEEQDMLAFAFLIPPDPPEQQPNIVEFFFYSPILVIFGFGMKAT